MKFDSKEEEYFSWYLDELKEAGYIKYYESQPESYLLSNPVCYEFVKELKTKTKKIKKTLVREHSYKPDFKIAWCNKAIVMFYQSLCSGKDLGKSPFIANSQISIIEIKPAFDQNNMTRLFTLNQKWVGQIWNIYIQKVMINKKNGKGLFAETFTPGRYLLTDKTKKPRKLRYSPRTLSEYILERQGF